MRNEINEIGCDGEGDGSYLLKVVGETRTYFQRDSHSLLFEGLVVENLDSDVLAGIPFME